jgi:hypothetical protein
LIRLTVHTCARCQGYPQLALNDGADIVHPARFTASASSLPALDRSSAGFADLPQGMSKMIFPHVLVTFVEVIGKSLALTRDMFPPGYKSSHLHSLLRPDTDL